MKKAVVNCIFLLLFVVMIQTSSFSETPSIIEKLQERERLSITTTPITNQRPAPTTLYPYTNNDLGISFDIPEGWEPFDHDAEQGYFLALQHRDDFTEFILCTVSTDGRLFPFSMLA